MALGIEEFEPITRWRGKVKGIECEIKHWERDNSFIRAAFPDEPLVRKYWTFYHIIRKEQVEEFDKVFLGAPVREGLRLGREWVDYYELNLDDLFEFHGGITFYEILRDHTSGEIIGVKVGCDFQHSWDEGKEYSFESVRAECVKSVEKFIKSFPDYKVWSSWDGTWHKADEVEDYNRSQRLANTR